MAMTRTWLGAVAIGVLGVAAPVMAQAPIQFKSEDGTTTVSVGMLAQGAFSLDTGGPSSLTDLCLRRFRVIIGGKIATRLKFFAETDTPYLGHHGSTWAVPPTIVQDAFATYEVRKELMIDAGLMLPPGAYNAMQSAATLLAPAYGPYAFYASAPTYSRIGRDQGIQARGILARGQIEYRVGAFRGLSRVVPGAPRRYAARLAWSPFGSQTGFFYAGTFQGQRKMFVMGASIDREGQYTALGTDVFLEIPSKARGTVTFQADAVFIDGGTTLKTLAPQNTFFAEAGYTLPSGRWGVFGQAARQDLRAVASPDASSVQGGVAYWLRASRINIKAGLGRTFKTNAATHLQVMAQAQVFLF